MFLAKKDPIAARRMDHSQTLPLHYAIKNNLPFMTIKYLIKLYPEALHCVDSNELFPFHLAFLYYNDLKLFQLLRTNYRDVIVHQMKKYSSSSSSTTLSPCKGNCDVIKKLAQMKDSLPCDEDLSIEMQETKRMVASPFSKKCVKGTLESKLPISETKLPTTHKIKTSILLIEENSNIETAGTTLETSNNRTPLNNGTVVKLLNSVKPKYGTIISFNVQNKIYQVKIMPFCKTENIIDVSWDDIALPEDDQVFLDLFNNGNYLTKAESSDDNSLDCNNSISQIDEERSVSCQEQQAIIALIADNKDSLGTNSIVGKHIINQTDDGTFLPFGCIFGFC